MAGSLANVTDYGDKGTELQDGKFCIKIICLGDSAVGKSKLVERFLIDKYDPRQLSTYALTLFNYSTELEGETISVDFWDTAGQERFSKVHPSYYYQAHACILVFDVTRKITYKNLGNWYRELREYRPEIPVLCTANKIDVDIESTKKSFAFPKKNGLPLYFVSAADGTNVVKLFKDSIKAAVCYKKDSNDFLDLVMEELKIMKLKEEASSDKGDRITCSKSKSQHDNEAPEADRKYEKNHP